MKVYDNEDKEHDALKLPYSRKTNCIAYEANGKCEHYGHSFIPGGCWEGSICLHPEAQGNKRGWLIKCPLLKL